MRGTLLNGKPSAVLLTYIHLHDKPDLDILQRINWAKIKHIPFAPRCEPFVGRLMGKTCELGLLRKCCFTHTDGPTPHPAGEKCPAQETLYRRIFRMTEMEYAASKDQRDNEKTDRKRSAQTARHESYNKMTKTAREAYDKKKMCGWWERGRCSWSDGGTPARRPRATARELATTGTGEWKQWCYQRYGTTRGPIQVHEPTGS